MRCHSQEQQGPGVVRRRPKQPSVDVAKSQAWRLRTAHTHTHTQTDIRTHKHSWTAYGPFLECRTQKLMFEAHQAGLARPDSHHLLDRLSGVRLSWWTRSTQLKHCYLHSLWLKKNKKNKPLFLKSGEVCSPGSFHLVDCFCCSANQECFPAGLSRASADVHVDSWHLVFEF